MAVMNIPVPKLDNFETSNDTLTFHIKNMNVSLVNSLRRVILSEIPTVVFRTMPYEKSLVNIEKNKTRLNNEIIKQRLSCIPIHITDLSIPIDKYIVELNVKNETNETQYVTTKDLRIKNIENDKYLTAGELARIFPENSITKEHIIISRLRPRLSDDIPGEELKLTAKMVISNAKEDSCFNVVSTCAYEFLRDVAKVQEEWGKKEKEYRTQGVSDADIMFERENFMIHDAKRHYTKDTYKFIIETIGVFDNKTILSKACDIMNDKLQSFIDASTSRSLIIHNAETLMKAYDIVLENEDYTLGKCIEYALHKMYFTDNKILDFVGFRKQHPHDEDSIIRVSFREEGTDKDAIHTLLKDCCETLQKVFTGFKEQL